MQGRCMREALRMAMEDMVNANESLADAVMPLPSVFSEYYDLPRVLREEEHEEINHYPDVIPIENCHTGVSCEPSALSAMLNEYGDIGYSTRIATRHPGVICKTATDNQNARVNELVHKVNQARLRFVRIAHQEKDKNIRYEVVHEMFPMLIMRNIQREVECLRNPEKFYLGWGNKPIVTRPDFEYVEKRLMDDMSKEAPHHMTQKEWVDKVRNEISNFQRFNKSERIRIRRPVKSQPIATIDGCAKVCPIPKLVLMSGDTAPKFKGLMDFDKSKSKPRGKKVEWRPIIDRYHIYAAY